MSTITNLDVLVVYSASIAESATIQDSEGMHPFRIDSKRAHYNLSYAYFLEACKKRGLTAGFTSSSDIIGPGTTKSYWTYSGSNWRKVCEPAKSSHIFAKISPVNKTRTAERQLLLSDPKIIPFNCPDLRNTFFDKLLTHRQLSKYSVPTVGLRSSKPEVIANSLARLRALVERHPLRKDFSQSIILKDRYGAGGNYVYKVTRDYQARIAKLMTAAPHVQFVLQPFLRFDRGYYYQNIPSTTDIRLIYKNNQIIQSYLRIASGDEFLCNEHQGGDLIYVQKTRIPESVIRIGDKIANKLDKPSSLYALDFVISNSGKVYFLEGNIGPGIDWDVTKPKNERMSKELIDHIVAEFVSRIHS